MGRPATKTAKPRAVATVPIVDGDAPPVQPVAKPDSNPAIQPAPVVSAKADTPLAGASVAVNDDGYTPGEQLSLAQILARRKQAT